MSSYQHQFVVDDSGKPIVETPKAEETAPASESDQEQRPSWLPENFNSPEDFKKSYDELRKEFTKAKQELSGLKKQSEGEPDSTLEGENQEAREALQTVGLDFDEFANRFYENGKLLDDDYETLESKGIPRHVVDQFIAGTHALQSQYESQALNAIGGEENFKAMASWAQANKTPEELAAYDRAVRSGDFDMMLMAVKGMYSDFTKAQGSDPQFVRAQSGAPGGEVFRSKAELIEAMRDPRYMNDAAYRNDVDQRLMRSANSGVFKMS